VVIVLPNKKVIILLGIILLVLAGCKGGSSGKSITDADVRKGTNGLLIEFLKNAPPESVFENSPFPIGIKLKNNGASDITLGFLSIGLEKTYITVVDTSAETQKFEIKGKSIFNINGDEEFITVNTLTKGVGAQSETHPSTILATACYQYKTILGSSVCIDTDIFGTKLRDKACEVKNLDFANGQGAPVAITKIETRMLPDVLNPDIVKPHFIIHVENKGNGEVIIPDEKKIEDACKSSALDFKDFNRMIITASLSNQPLNCNIGEDFGEGKIRLRKKKDVVRCTLDEGIESSRDAYTAPLKIELDYGYTFTISKDVTIEKIFEY